MRKKRKIISEEEKSLAIEMYLKDGLSTRKIGKFFNVDRGVVERAIVKSGNSMRTSKECHLKLTKNEDLEIYKMYYEKYTPEEIGKKFNVSDNTIRYSIKRQGGELRNFTQSITKYNFNHDFFEKIDTEAKAYFLGFWLADGNVWNNKVQMSLHPKDSYIMESFVKHIDGNNVIHFYKYKRDSSRLSITSKKMVDDLIDKGIVPNKTFELNKMPDIQDNLEKHFWRGVLDGDGWVLNTQKNKMIETGICNKQKIAMEYFKKFLEKHDISPCKIQYANQSVYRIWLTARRAIKFLNLIYEGSSPDLRLKRKYNNYIKAKKYRIKNNLPSF
jgi:predicted DNA-binding protein YlxM (UPF0122 family)